jgi:hypothetical protein
MLRLPDELGEDRDTVIAVVGQNLKSGSMARGESLGHTHLTCPLLSQRQFARGDLGVEAVLDAARRIAVTQPDKRFLGGG